MIKDASVPISYSTHLDLVEVVLEQSVDSFLELGRKVEAVLLEPGSPLQPELDALAQRRLTFRGHQLLRRVGNVLEDSVVVLLVVLDPVFLKSKHDMNYHIDNLDIMTNLLLLQTTQSVPDHSTHWFNSESVLQLPELQALEAGGAGEVFPKVHEVERSHRLEDVHLVDQDLK